MASLRRPRRRVRWPVKRGVAHPATVNPREDGLAAALHAAGPAAGHEGVPGTFTRFIGSWHLRWQHVARGLEAVGELHFGWVLGGRAIQDVWIVPGPGQPGAGVPPHAFHGSTIRFYDPDLGAWRSTWIEPVNGRVRKFIGREDAGQIVLISLDGAPLLRWRFTEIRPDSFVWLGEYSLDEGRTWQLEERMLATRATPPE